MRIHDSLDAMTTVAVVKVSVVASERGTASVNLPLVETEIVKDVRDLAHETEIANVGDVVVAGTGNVIKTKKVKANCRL